MSSSEEYIIADRSASPGAGRRLRVRIGESLFRRWPLYLLPIILFIGIGVVAAKDVAQKYVSVGTVNVASSTYLSTQTDVNTPNFGYDTPAVKTARDIVQHLGTDSFARTVATNAGLDTAIKSGLLTLNNVRASIVATATGDNLLEVVATTNDASVSQRLATSVITSYTSYVLSVNNAQYNTTVTYSQGNLVADEANLAAANTALDAYLTKNPTPAVGAVPALQTVQSQRLSDAVKAAQTQRDNDQALLDKAQLAIKQSESDIGQRLQVIDQPVVPDAPQPIKVKRALTFTIFLILGLIVSVAALVVSALLDRSVRSVGDISSIPGLHVIGTIPKQRTRRRSSGRLVPELGVEATAS